MAGHPAIVDQVGAPQPVRMLDRGQREGIEATGRIVNQRGGRGQVCLRGRGSDQARQPGQRQFAIGAAGIEADAELALDCAAQLKEQQRVETQLQQIALRRQLRRIIETQLGCNMGAEPADQGIGVMRIAAGWRGEAGRCAGRGQRPGCGRRGDAQPFTPDRIESLRHDPHRQPVGRSAHYRLFQVPQALGRTEGAHAVGGEPVQQGGIGGMTHVGPGAPGHGNDGQGTAGRSGLRQSVQIGAGQGMRALASRAQRGGSGGIEQQIASLMRKQPVVQLVCGFRFECQYRCQSFGGEQGQRHIVEPAGGVNDPVDAAIGLQLVQCGGQLHRVRHIAAQPAQLAGMAAADGMAEIGPVRGSVWRQQGNARCALPYQPFDADPAQPAEGARDQMPALAAQAAGRQGRRHMRLQRQAGLQCLPVAHGDPA